MYYKIVFLCGSLEPGRDGVGDYTRRLAGELIRQGHAAAIIAINDKHISENIDGWQVSDSTSISVLRLSFLHHQKKRVGLASEWIANYNPDWISLQYVPFAFNQKGLHFGLGKLLSGFGQRRSWHIMVHELWVGMDEEATLKFFCWGWLQRQLIKSLFFKLNPSVIHTQCNIYIKMLEKIGFKPQYLPLFGNIPLIDNILSIDLQKTKDNNDGKTISIVAFGSIHHGAPIRQFVQELYDFYNNSGIKVIIKLIGRCGPEGQVWEQICKEEGLKLEYLGELPEEIISEIFTNSSFGISTTPVALIEKSGSVAAMREHGLIILCISRAWHPRGIKELKLPDGIVQYKQGKVKDFILCNARNNSVNHLSEVTSQFVNNLSSSV